MQYENEMMQLEIEAQRAKNNSTSSVGGSGSGSDNTISGDDSTLRQNILNMITSGNYDEAVVRDMINSSNLTEQDKQNLLHMLGNGNVDNNVNWTWSNEETNNAGRLQLVMQRLVGLRNSPLVTENQILDWLDQLVADNYITRNQADYAIYYTGQNW